MALPRKRRVGWRAIGAVTHRNSLKRPDTLCILHTSALARSPFGQRAKVPLNMNTESGKWGRME